MKLSPELRASTANKLESKQTQAGQTTAFVGLDGFVDEIFHVVDKRESADKFTRLPTIAQFAERLAGAAGKSTNVEMVSLMTKLGGNGPIMGNALASLGLKVSYLGNLGFPNIHPIFSEFANRAEVHSIAEPGYTDALEFEDGKIMVGKHQALKQVTWENVCGRYGRDKFAAKFAEADLVGFVNWTMLTGTTGIWEAVLKEVCPKLSGKRRRLFFDLADPEKRTKSDIVKALQLISQFQKWFDVILGLNEKESYEIVKALDLPACGNDPSGLQERCKGIYQAMKVDTVVVHPTAYALATGPDGTSIVEGPFTPKPKITTGAGDHFNSGFCLGKLMGLSTEESLLAGVTTSGYYVRTGSSPSISDLAGMLRNWPAKEN
jgi:sugar/nucleoside kinase (ribokinase family)